MKPRSAIKTDLFADEHQRKKIDTLGDPLIEIGSRIDFAALAAEVEQVDPPSLKSAGWASAVHYGGDGAHPGLEAPVQPAGRTDGVPVT
jgi:hypothetical protein